MINIDQVIKRANKLIEKAKNKINASKVHIVHHDTDITNLTGLVIILNKKTSKTPNNNTQAKQELTNNDIKENL